MGFERARRTWVRRERWRALVALAGVVAGFAATAPPAATASTATLTPTGWQTDPEVWGINSRALFATNTLTVGQIDSRITSIQRLGGVKWVRTTVNWPLIQAAGGNGVDDWTATDLVVRRLALAGLRWRPVTLDTPAWNRKYPWYAQRQPPYSAAWTAVFLDKLLDRYGPSGSFWAANPDLTPRPVTDLELHNEPNSKYFWGKDPNSTSLQNYRTDYNGASWGIIYGTALDTVAAQHPDVRYWMGGLVTPRNRDLAPGVAGGESAVAFVQNAFAAHPSLVNTLAGVAVHAYPAVSPVDPADSVANVAAVVTALRTYGGQDKQIQLNEYSVANPQQTTTEQVRVDYIHAMSDLVRSGCPVQGLAPFEEKSSYAGTDIQDYFGLINGSDVLLPHGQGYADDVTAYDAGVAQGPLLTTCTP